jgi:dihydrofolate reductase
MSSTPGRRQSSENANQEDSMGSIVVSQFVTLDGVVEDPGGSEKFERGGWAFQYERGEEGDKFKLDELMASDALLLGRITFEGFAAAWPSREGDFADKFNTMPKYVVSTTLESPDWNNSTVIEGDVPARVAELREQYVGDVLVNGSVQLVHELLARGLVDELRLMVFPVVLGAGKRLFGGTESSLPMQLVESRQVGPDGVAILIYRPA